MKPKAPSPTAKAAAAFVGPVYLRFGRDVYPVVPEIHGDFTIGRAKVLREGDDVALVTTGIMVSEGLRAAEDLRARGHCARVIHVPTVKPLDEAVLLDAARQTRGLVTVEEHSILGGFERLSLELLAKTIEFEDHGTKNTISKGLGRARSR